MKKRDYLIIILLLAFTSTLLFKADTWIGNIYPTMDSITYYKERVSKVERWLVHAKVRVIQYEDSINAIITQYEDSIIALRADREIMIAKMQQRKINRLNASDEELIQELQSRISNIGSPGIFELTSNGVIYILEVIDDRDQYKKEVISMNKEISHMDKVNTEKDQTIAMLNDVINEGSSKFETQLKESTKYLDLYEAEVLKNATLTADNKKLKFHRLVLIGVVVLEATIIILSK